MTCTATELADLRDELQVKDRQISKYLEVIEEQKGLIRSLRILSTEIYNKNKYLGYLEEIIKVVNGYSWICGSRGSYEFDDDRYQEETGKAFEEILDIATLGIRNTYQIELSFDRSLTIAETKERAGWVKDVPTDNLDDYADLFESASGV